jgi:hypothetical protein
MKDILAYMGTSGLRFKKGDRLLLNSIVRSLAKLPRVEELRAAIHAAICLLVANRFTLSSVNAWCLEDTFLTQAAGNPDGRSRDARLRADIHNPIRTRSATDAV